VDNPFDRSFTNRYASDMGKKEQIIKLYTHWPAYLLRHTAK
jgi:hypothetical protein